MALKLMAEGLTSPIALVPAPDLSGRRFIVDQIGVIRILTSEGRLLDQPFLDLREGPGGVVGEQLPLAAP